MVEGRGACDAHHRVFADTVGKAVHQPFQTGRGGQIDHRTDPARNHSRQPGFHGVEHPSNIDAHDAIEVRTGCGQEGSHVTDASIAH